MLVTVHLYTILQRESTDGWQRRLDMEIPAGSTVADLMAALDIRLPLDSLLLLVNGRMAELDTSLHAADHVHFIPALSGG